jgi:tetratricopeptide (TPR) repeat protein
MAVGFDQVLADWYWVEALQYFTDTAQEINRYRNLGDFLDVVVGVDPDFEYAYKFAGISIPYDTGRFHFANTDRAIDFLQRGVKRFPNNWELHFHLGFYLLNFRDDPPGAAEQFAAAARIEGSPAYLKLFAARLFSVSGELERARVFTETMLASAADDSEREQLKKRIREIDLEHQLRDLESAAQRFHDQWGRWPTPAEVTVAYGVRLPSADVRLVDGKASVPDHDRMVVHEHPTEDRVRALQ